MSALYKKLVRLAHEKPELRGDLLPLLKEARVSSKTAAPKIKDIVNLETSNVKAAVFGSIKAGMSDYETKVNAYDSQIRVRGKYRKAEFELVVVTTVYVDQDIEDGNERVPITNPRDYPSLQNSYDAEYEVDFYVGNQRIFRTVFDDLPKMARFIQKEMGGFQDALEKFFPKR